MVRSEKTPGNSEDEEEDDDATYVVPKEKPKEDEDGDDDATIIDPNSAKIPMKKDSDSDIDII